MRSSALLSPQYIKQGVYSNNSYINSYYMNPNLDNKKLTFLNDIQNQKFVQQPSQNFSVFVDSRKNTESFLQKQIVQQTEMIEKQKEEIIRLQNTIKEKFQNEAFNVELLNQKIESKTQMTLIQNKLKNSQLNIAQLQEQFDLMNKKREQQSQQNNELVQQLQKCTQEKHQDDLTINEIKQQLFKSQSEVALQQNLLNTLKYEITSQHQKMLMQSDKINRLENLLIPLQNNSQCKCAFNFVEPKIHERNYQVQFLNKQQEQNMTPKYFEQKKNQQLGQTELIKVINLMIKKFYQLDLIFNRFETYYHSLKQIMNNHKKKSIQLINHFKQKSYYYKNKYQQTQLEKVKKIKSLQMDLNQENTNKNYQDFQNTKENLYNSLNQKEEYISELQKELLNYKQLGNKIQQQKIENLKKQTSQKLLTKQTKQNIQQSTDKDARTLANYLRQKFEKNKLSIQQKMEQ